ncbi:hypothetical protein GCM10011501_05740 [Thalassotalea profundi]|uniref:Uncharacterized protein n=2 Tax=Thalassotalea profundi TaxID=2036687 RepID=A0ABQ3IFS5_9GAMM|nr:hypothetical protein GCM10011501_05740 [Thalassotalea profundi]
MGLSASVVAPDMFKMLERVQKREEQMTISATLKLIKEKSFFSSNGYFITFIDNQFSVYEYLAEQRLYSNKELALMCNSDKDLEEQSADEEPEAEKNCRKLKEIYSRFYTFEELSFFISGGKINEHQFIKFFENSSIPSVTLEID